VLGTLAVLVWQCGGSTMPGGYDASSDVVPSGSGGGSGANLPGDASGGCNPACASTLTCCAGACVQISSDPRNCGACGVVCTGETSFCDDHCKAPPCDQDAATCAAGSCCGSQCCTQGQYCCPSTVSQGGPPLCNAPLAGGSTCPIGCVSTPSSPCIIISDRERKRDIEPVNRGSVLESLTGVPISTWSYASDNSSTRHMGPMAQDFRAAFGLGDSDGTYYPVDAHGVALAAIQAVYERVKAQELRIERLEMDNAELHARCRGRGEE
jgi:Stigma-specific protein, Stig1/Chaperone of endosialidase